MAASGGRRDRFYPCCYPLFLLNLAIPMLTQMAMYLLMLYTIYNP